MATKTKTLAERLQDAQAEVRMPRSSGGQNWALAQLFAQKLEQLEVEGFTLELREHICTQPGASSMIRVLKDELGIGDKDDILPRDKD